MRIPLPRSIPASDLAGAGARVVGLDSGELQQRR